MSLGAYQVPRDAGTVMVHVQIIDLQPFSLDLVVPTYLPARDLTQRVARDAGLGGYWPDGTRREYWLRARGRLMQPEEKLQDLGVVPGELLHLLPQPPPGSGLQERPPEYPENRGYAAAGNINVLFGLFTVFLWTGLWATALTVRHGIVYGLFPGVGLSLLCTSFSRHLWGGLGSQVRIPVTAFLLFGSLLLLAGVPTFVIQDPLADIALSLGTAFVGGAFGILLGWLAWYGAVEPLPEIALKEVKAAEALVTWPCGICGGPVTVEVKADCAFGCGRVFHQGCYAAKNAMSDGKTCAVCGLQAPAA
ncbi:MAG: hypothetical protein H6735_00915 [Alphaproteobacteria bacterium]|nr:hypothetical protein [Alphaproteobacteria bacterium]